MLLENEKQKIAEVEKKHKMEMEAWREKIEPRKQVSTCLSLLRLNISQLFRHGTDLRMPYLTF
jgi:hypothetical protein